MAGNVDLFESLDTGKEGLPDIHAKLIGRRWGNAFPIGNMYDAKVLEGWLFGEPTLEAANNSCANWVRGSVSPLDQKGSTGWLANLYGGVQTGDDWARVNIPVNEMPIGDLTTALWSYYMTDAQTMGVGIVIWIHDPEDFDKRAEITQLANVAGLEKGSGWNAHELNLATTQFFFYGENTTGTDLTAGTQYPFTSFQADRIFSGWTIYRITLEYGWEASGTFADAWVADIKLNGMAIPLKPDSGGSGKVGRRHYAVADTAAHTLAPKTGFRLLSIDCEISTAGTTSESLTVTKDALAGDTYDTLLYSVNTLTGSSTGGTITSLFVPFGEGYDFEPGDELEMAWGNTENRNLGFTWTYQTVF